MRSALVLAGGRSSRFEGGDKALAEVDGEPMVRRVAERTAPVADELIVNCRADQRGDFEAVLSGLDYRLAVDPVPDGGPVAGVRTGLRVARGSAAAIVGCDMPRVDADLFERLFEVHDDAAVPRTEGGLCPLHAAYDVRAARRAAERTLAAGSRRVYDLLARLDPVVVDVEAVDEAGTDPFRDVDTRTDLDALTGETA